MKYLFKSIQNFHAVYNFLQKNMQVIKNALTGGLSKMPVFKPKKYEGPPFQEVWANHKKHMFPFYRPEYFVPFFAVEGRGQYLYDDKGRQFLDLTAGIATCSVGHCHPRIHKIFKDQASKLIHISPIYMHQYHGEYCKALCEELGEGFETVYLCNSGSQANDFAANIVRLYTQSQKIYALRNGYHGISGNALALTSVQNRHSFLPKAIDIQKLAMPNSYRSPQTLETLAYDAQQLMDSTSNGRIAGTWIEPVMGAGGIFPLPDGYFKKIAEITRKYGGLVVSDQVQTGFGRIGKDFWGFKMHGVKPDIVITAKAMANGYPMAAVTTSRKIMRSIETAHFHTYGGGPIQCRIGLEVLKILRDQKLPQNASLVGGYLLKEFKRIGDKCPKIGDVRGVGMMIGIQFVKSKECKTPDPQTTAKVLNQMKDLGILMTRNTPHIIRMVGALCITMEDAKRAVSVVEQVMSKLA